MLRKSIFLLFSFSLFSLAHPAYAISSGESDWAVAMQSVSKYGVQSAGYSIAERISTNGRYTVFFSEICDLTDEELSECPEYSQGMMRRDNLTGEVVNIDKAFDHRYGRCMSSDDSTTQFVCMGNLKSDSTYWDESIWYFNYETNEQIQISTNAPTQFIQSTYGNGLQISDDGQKIAFWGYQPLNGEIEGGLWLWEKGQPQLRNLTSPGPHNQINLGSIPRFSGDGKFLMFSVANEWFNVSSNPLPDEAINMPQYYYVSTENGLPTRIIPTKSSFSTSEISISTMSSNFDGSLMVFASDYSRYVNGDINGNWDVFVFNRLTGEISLVSKLESGIQASGYSGEISPDGKLIAISSPSSKFVTGDNANTWDLFLLEIETGKLLYSTVVPGGMSEGFGGSPGRWSADSMSLTFTSSTSQLVPFDENGKRDSFIVSKSKDSAGTLFAKESDTGILLKWDNPGDTSEVVIRASSDGIPSGANDGKLVYRGSGTQVFINDLSPNKEYGFALFTYGTSPLTMFDTSPLALTNNWNSRKVTGSKTSLWLPKMPKAIKQGKTAVIELLNGKTRQGASVHLKSTTNMVCSVEKQMVGNKFKGFEIKGKKPGSCKISLKVKLGKKEISSVAAVRIK